MSYRWDTLDVDLVLIIDNRTGKGPILLKNNTYVAIWRRITQVFISIGR